jgi:hypothetical protein
LIGYSPVLIAFVTDPLYPTMETAGDAKRQTIMQPQRDLNAIRQIRNSDAYKQTLSSVRILSFVLASYRIVDMLKGKTEITPPSVIAFFNDTLFVLDATVTSVAGKLGFSPPKFPSSLEAMATPKRLADARFFRVFVRYAMIGLVTETIYDLYGTKFETKEAKRGSLRLRRSKRLDRKLQLP